MNDRPIPDPDFDDPEIWLREAKAGQFTVHTNEPWPDVADHERRVQEHELHVALGPSLLAHIANRHEQGFEQRIGDAHRAFGIVAAADNVDIARAWFVGQNRFPR